METPKEYYYTYYSYEEWGRGYIGSRGCNCLPEEDIKYFGSFSDKTFHPTQKIILKDDYDTREEAIADEIILQEYYKVVENLHFANKSYQTSTKFSYKISKEEWERGNKQRKELGIGIYAITPKQRSEIGKKGGNRNVETGHIQKLGKEWGNKCKEEKIGVCGLTKDQRTENGRKGAEKSKELKVGIFAMTPQELSEAGKKGGKIGGKRTKELKIGIFARTKDEMIEHTKKINSQKWMCLETEYVSTAAGVVAYQKARGIDTSKRKRIA